MRGSFCSSLVLFSGLLWRQERQLHVHTQEERPIVWKGALVSGACVKIASSEPWDNSSHRGVFIFSRDSFWFVLSRVNQAVWSERGERQLFTEESVSEVCVSAEFQFTEQMALLLYFLYCQSVTVRLTPTPTAPLTRTCILKYFFCTARDGMQGCWRHFVRRQYELQLLSASATTVKVRKWCGAKRLFF